MDMELNNMNDFKKDQKTLLIDIEGIGSKISNILSSSDINTVSDLLDADMGDLLKISGMDEELLDEAYEGVQSFIEREIEADDEEADEQLKLDKNENNIDLMEEE
jgi:Bacterial RNA polymerase, alpha chain C terminal domain.